MDLICRRCEMAQIGQLLRRAAAGSGNLVVITSPRGSRDFAPVNAAIDDAGRRLITAVRAAPAVRFAFSSVALDVPTRRGNLRIPQITWSTRWQSLKNMIYRWRATSG